MSTKIHNVLLGLIILLAAVLRLYQIGNYPSLNSDEAAIGYNAYSLLQTGKDEHGASWPLHFKSFGDYKPGGYFYLVLPFVKLLGLTPLSVRLPNALLSILSIFIFYLIVKHLTRNRNLALLSALVLSISPWHLHFSRGGWESSAALSFILLGTYFFFREKYLLFAFFFSASLYTYHSARLVSPLLVLLLITIYWKKLTANWKKLILPLIFGILISLPVVLSFLKNGGTSRFGGVGLTADYGPVSRSEELLNQHGFPLLSNRIIHNKRLLYLLSWGQKYFSHYDLNFLFVNGDEVPRSKVPEMGQFYLLELPLMLLGLYLFFKVSQISLQSKLFFSGFALIAPIASSLTFQAPSALRSLPLVIPLSFFISLGLYYLINRFKQPLPTALIVLGYIFSLTYYLDAYYVHYEKRYPFAWEYGFSQAIPYIESQKSRYPAIYLTDTYDQPYIYYLFYTRYQPASIQSQIKLTPPDKFGFSTVSKIDNIHFGPIDWPNITPGSLVVSGKDEIPATPNKVILSPSGQPLFKFFVK